MGKRQVLPRTMLIAYEGTGRTDKWVNNNAPAGSFETNGYGLCDMGGNVGNGGLIGMMKTTTLSLSWKNPL